MPQENEMERLRRLSSFITDLVPNLEKAKKNLLDQGPRTVSEILNTKAEEGRRQFRPEGDLPPVIIKFQRAVNRLIGLKQAERLP